MKIILTAFFALTSLTFFGQKIYLTGKVTDQNNNPVPFATLKLKGTSLGTCTTADGRYIIYTDQSFDSIICTHIDYESASEAFEGNTLINFSLTRKTPIESSIEIIDSSIDNQLPISDSIDHTFYQLGPFTKVEINAAFPGGQKALLSYLNRTISLQDTTRKQNGAVKVSFIINTSGTASNIRLIKGVNSDLDNKVIDAVKNMPKWTPAMQNGRYVDQERYVAVLFKSINN